MKRFFIIVLTIFLTSNVIANERDDKLNVLFEKLKKSLDPTTKIEQEIWSLWITHPSDNNLTTKLEEGSMLMQRQQIDGAISIFTEVIRLDPSWAEAWNKRATAYYMVGEFQKSQEDIDQVLKLEKRHFGALAGQGMVNIQLKNFEKALESYKRVQEIHPSMKSPKIMIKEIQEFIKNQSI